MEITFLKAIMTHLKLEGESLGQFREHMSKLTTTDREQLKMQFAQEFGYTITESKA